MDEVVEGGTGADFSGYMGESNIIRRYWVGMERNSLRQMVVAFSKTVEMTVVNM